MEDKKNTIKVYTTCSGAELNISAPSIKQAISATNNRAQYFAEQAMKYRDEAKIYKDTAKYYSEQNSDVTFEYVNNIKTSLEDKISQKQDVGNYALKEELPVSVSELENDSNYVTNSQLTYMIENFVDVEQLSSSLELKADKTEVDGQWVPAAQNVLQNVGVAARSERTIDLSNYLPNDGHNYEVIIVAWVKTGATSGYEVALNIYNEFLPELRWVTAVTRTSNNNQATGVMTLPIGQERNFTLKSATDYPFDLVSDGIRSYRRIGTNL